MAVYEGLWPKFWGGAIIPARQNEKCRKKRNRGVRCVTDGEGSVLLFWNVCGAEGQNRTVDTSLFRVD